MSSHDLKKQFQELSTALQSLHRDLLMMEAKTLEGESGRKLSPYDLLHASLHDPNLAWLRQISSLIVNSATPITPAGGSLFPVQVTGAGLMNVNAALASTAARTSGPN